MQPDSSSKPVMDVTPPRPLPTPSVPGPSDVPTISASPMPAPSAPGPVTATNHPPLAVHEPPKGSEDQTSRTDSTKSNSPTEPKVSASPAGVPQPKKAPKPGPHKQASPLPVGAILMALLVMAILSALTVTAYLYTN